ncbi:MAG: molecular chaperone DnaJ [Desulfitibacter sp. BRH_c19]|nr:MAG: molecular chaperone DnaJ [Desulfitibacter sp. BRH_c19]
MRLIKKLSGKILYAIARTLSIIMEILIQLIETVVLFVRSVFKGCVALISMGGCLLFFLIVGPLGFRILMDPVTLYTILFLLILSTIGVKFVYYLKYLKFITTGFLFNLANYLMDGMNYQYKSLSEYKVAYKKAEEERKRREQQRYYEQQRQWGERIKQQWHQQNSQRWQGSNGDYGGQGSFQYGYLNPSAEFKNKYERSSDVLGVSYDVDKNQIKLAYRRKAKEYHPDLNKVPGATKMFQEINDAYEFLNDDNIQRYKNVQKNE